MSEFDELRQRLAEAESERDALMVKVAGFEHVLDAFDKVIKKAIVEAPGAHRVRLNGEWYTGPLADHHLNTMKAIQRIAQTALTAERNPQ